MKTPIEDRLRAALHDAAAQVRPSQEPRWRAEGQSRVRWRNRRALVAALAAVVVVAVVATAVVVFDRREDTTEQPAGPVGPQEVSPDELPRLAADLEVFMANDSRTADVAVVRNTILTTSGVERYTYVDHQDAYEEFRRIFRDDPDLLKAVDPEALPTAFRVELDNPAAAPGLRRQLELIPGVEEVTNLLLDPGGAEFRR